MARPRLLGDQVEGFAETRIAQMRNALRI